MPELNPGDHPFSVDPDPPKPATKRATKSPLVSTSTVAGDLQIINRKLDALLQVAGVNPSNLEVDHERPS